jgi:hypothetical protein
MGSMLRPGVVVSCCLNCTALQALVSNSQQHNGRQPLSLRAIVSDLRLVDKGRLH